LALCPCRLGYAYAAKYTKNYRRETIPQGLGAVYRVVQAGRRARRESTSLKGVAANWDCLDRFIPTGFWFKDYTKTIFMNYKEIVRAVECQTQFVTPPRK
jgi:hypothetical protein